MLKNQTNLIGYSIAVFLVINLLIYLPFFSFTPFVGMTMDSFDYYWLAEKIFKGELPQINGLIDLPVGFPLFLAFIKCFSDSLILILWIQVVFFLLSSCFLIYQSKKISHLAPVFTSIGLILYSFHPFIIEHTLTINTESFFISALLILSGLMIGFYFEKKTSIYILISCCVLVLILIRSNGIVFLFLPFWIILSISKKELLKFSLVLVISILLNCVINYMVKGKFMLGDFERIKARIAGMNYANELAEGVYSKKSFHIEYYKGFHGVNESYFFEILPYRYSKLNQYYTWSSDSLGIFDGTRTLNQVSPSIQRFIFQNNHFNFSEFDEGIYTLKSETRNPWFLFSHYAYQFIYYSGLLKLLQFMFALYFSMNLFLAIINKNLFRQPSWTLQLSFIYIATLILLPYMHYSIWKRYILVTEFVVYVLSIFAIHDFIKIIRSYTIKK